MLEPARDRSRGRDPGGWSGSSAIRLSPPQIPSYPTPATWTRTDGYARHRRAVSRACIVYWQAREIGQFLNARIGLSVAPTAVRRLPTGPEIRGSWPAHFVEADG